MPREYASRFTNAEPGGGLILALAYGSCRRLLWALALNLRPAELLPDLPVTRRSALPELADPFPDGRRRRLSRLAARARLQLRAAVGGLQPRRLALGAFDYPDKVMRHHMRHHRRPSSVLSVKPGEHQT